MKIIAFLNPKGGSGKTTATINVSSCLASSGKKIAVVDTDPQMSLTNWNKAEKAAFDVYTAASEKDVYQVRKDLAEYDFVIIDGAGSLSVITSAAGSVVTVLEAQAYNRPVEARFLITRKIEQATMLNVLKDSIAQTGIKPFKTAITQRQSYVKSVMEGESVFDTNDGAAKGEIAILTREILDSFE